MKIMHKIGFAFLVGILSLGFADTANAKKKNDKNQWYVSISATAVNPADDAEYTSLNNLTFGRLSESSDGYDRHDIRPYSDLSGARISLLFHQDDWGDNSGQYLNDYRHSKEKDGAWLFTVHSSIPGALVTLDWTPLVRLKLNPADSPRYLESSKLNDKLLKKSILIDLETFEVVDAVTKKKVLNNYDFEMGESGTRQFLWVVGKVKDEYFDGVESLEDEVKAAKKSSKASTQAFKVEKRQNPDLPPEG